MRYYVFLLVFCMLTIGGVSNVSAQDFNGSTTYIGTNITGNHTLLFSNPIDVSEINVNVTRSHIQIPYHIDDDSLNVTIKTTLPASDSINLTINKTSGYSPNGTDVFNFYFGADSTDELTSKFSGDTGLYSIVNGSLKGSSTNSAEIYASVNGGIDGKIIESKINSTSSGVTDLLFGLEYQIDSSNRAIFNRRHTATFDNRWGDGSTYFSTVPPKWTDSTPGRDKIEVGSTVAASTHTFDGTTVSGVTDHGFSILPSGHIGVFSYGIGSTTQYLDWIKIRNDTTNLPTVVITDQGTYYSVQITNNEAFALNNFQVDINGTDLGIASDTESLKIGIGEFEETIIVSVTGDSNSSSYTTGETNAFILTPTAQISNVQFNTSNETVIYDYNVTANWGEAIVTYTEAVSGGYANVSITYEPLETISTGTVDFTYSNINFSQHDYVGDEICTLDGSPTACTLTGNTISIPVSNLNTSEHVFLVSIPYNPQPIMFSPDGDTLVYSFPPLNHDVPANWEATTGEYRYTITTQGGVFVAQDMVTTNSTTFILPAGDYFWYIQGYDDVFEEYSSATTVFNFTVQNDYGILNTTAIVGIVYSQDGQTKTPITNAVVTITNDTWSDSIVVGSDGFYSFLDLAGNETYFLAASVEYFDDSGTIIVTTNPNNVTQRDILLTTTTTDYVPHYVKFIVKSLLGTKYQDVNINIYKGNTAAGVVFRSGVTGADGSATFRLDQNQQYTITFISETLGISETKTLYPVDNEYPIIVFRTNMVPDDRDQDDILFGAYGQSINLTHGYINISFNDTSGTTTSANAYIKDTNLTTLYSFSTTNSSATWSQIVEGGNATYIVEFDLQNTVLDDTLEITRTIKFSDVVNFDLGFDEGWKYIFVSSAILILILLLASKLNAEIMTGVTILAAWLLTFLGWTTAGLTTSQSITVGLMLLFGTILSFGAIIRRGEREL